MIFLQKQSNSFFMRELKLSITLRLCPSLVQQTYLCLRRVGKGRKKNGFGIGEEILRDRRIWRRQECINHWKNASQILWKIYNARPSYWSHWTWSCCLLHESPSSSSGNHFKPQISLFLCCFLIQIHNQGFKDDPFGLLGQPS